MTPNTFWGLRTVLDGDHDPPLPRCSRDSAWRDQMIQCLQENMAHVSHASYDYCADLQPDFPDFESYVQNLAHVQKV